MGQCFHCFSERYCRAFLDASTSDSCWFVAPCGADEGIVDSCTCLKFSVVCSCREKGLGVCCRLLLFQIVQSIVKVLVPTAREKSSTSRANVSNLERYLRVATLPCKRGVGSCFAHGVRESELQRSRSLWTRVLQVSHHTMPGANKDIRSMIGRGGSE